MKDRDGMTRFLDFTRRKFLGSSALLTAVTTMGQISETPRATTSYVTAAVFPYGAVSFCKSNPPEPDWARDHQTAAHIGMSIFCHWFMWSAIEVAPGKYDWRDYDRIIDLAAQNGIKVILSEIDICAPGVGLSQVSSPPLYGERWHAPRKRHLWEQRIGSFPGLCLDHLDARAAAELFLTTLIEHYRLHSPLLGYDLWDDGASIDAGPPRMYCYREGTKDNLRAMAESPYGTPEETDKRWHRYSYGT
jgi:beta-galactosidase